MTDSKVVHRVCSGLKTEGFCHLVVDVSSDADSDATDVMLIPR